MDLFGKDKKKRKTSKKIKEKRRGNKDTQR
jgi:hypothetical protein